jgi:integrase
VPGFVVEALRQELAVDRPRHVVDVVFAPPMGMMIDQRNVARRWAAHLEESGLPRIRMHDLRHTAASLLLAQGASLHDVMKALGHANIAETANVYGHLVEGRSRELADEMDRLLGSV